MLQIKNISKEYVVGDLKTKALDDVSLNLRDNEFVAILGPSGSGKTTLLNIIGGLDRYDSGDLIIGDISTKKYKDRDWDSYRNHTIGFVFQSYNLIPHQSVLSNVELALTISGISRKERKKRAMSALCDVGLKDHMHKRPNQLSGGQMQRVAIARALVNNPDILLADEPTGALDSQTSVQVMDLLKEVAKDRLVVMVTHNPELAQSYATRIVELKDGRITSDSNPCEAEQSSPAEHKSMGKASMSFFTALSLSFNNLLTKKGRTILTAFAGSIGIIGIALILSLSSGVDKYITDVQRDIMTSYPISITAEAIDLTSIMQMRGKTVETAKSNEQQTDKNAVNAGYRKLKQSEAIFSSVAENDLASFKAYLDDPSSEISKYLGENGVAYSYDVNFRVFSHDENGNVIDTNTSTDNLKSSSDSDSDLKTIMSRNMGTAQIMQNVASGASKNAANFQEMMPDVSGESVSKVITDSYDVLYGAWPQKYDEVVLVLQNNNTISADKLYQLGFITKDKYREIINTIEDNKDPDAIKWDYKEMCDKKFYLVSACDQYEENLDGTYTYIGSDLTKYDDMADKGLELKITGIVRPIDDAANATITTPVAYTSKLTDYIIEHTDKSSIIKKQESDPSINVLNNLKFAAKDDNAKQKDAKSYIKNLPVNDKANLYQAIMFYSKSDSDNSDKAVEALDGGNSADYSSAVSGMGSMTITNDMLASAMDSWLDDKPDKKILLSIYDEYIDGASYNNNLTNFGKVSYDAPSAINIYTDSFEAKDSIAACIENYNKTADEDKQIVYTDYVALLTSSITSIIDIISYVLIAFVSVSLVVSSIMIGIITYISVLERTKEIGILRAIGASKHNISQVFNAETFIIGLFSGLIGIGLSLLLTIPINAIIHHLAESTDINAILPPGAAALLVVLSVILTLIGGLIPSRKASKKDPVTSLRSE